MENKNNEQMNNLWHLPLVLWILNFLFVPIVQIFGLFGQHIGGVTLTPLQSLVVLSLQGQLGPINALWWANITLIVTGVLSIALSWLSLREKRSP